MLVRPAVESDHDRILAFIARDPIGWVDADTYRRYQTSGSYGIDRIWLAERDERLLACAVWYGSPATDHPLILDCLWVESDIGAKAALGGAVLRAGHASFQASGAQHGPEYHLFLKPAWQNDSENRLEVEWRRVAARSAGLTNERERLRYEWTSDVGLAQPSTRLVFSSQPRDEVFLDVFRRVAVGSLDQETQDTVAAEGLERHARKTLACHRGMRGDRAWWRTAHTPDGALVGFTIPSANEDFPVIGYLGVVPEMRGHGYAVDLLAEATRILAANGADCIRADTDAINLPMAATFERAHYRNFGVRLVMSSAASPTI